MSRKLLSDVAHRCFASLMRIDRSFIGLATALTERISVQRDLHVYNS
jgi:hypothetical protein